MKCLETDGSRKQVMQQRLQKVVKSPFFADKRLARLVGAASRAGLVDYMTRSCQSYSCDWCKRSRCCGWCSSDLNWAVWAWC